MKISIINMFRLVLCVGFVIIENLSSIAQTPMPKHDQDGNLLPLQSYAETLEKSMDFIIQDDFYKDDPKNLIDTKGIKRPAYFFYGELTPQGMQFENYFTSYPAFHHSLYIQTFIKYYIYSGNIDFLQRAVDLADWNIENSTPNNYLYGGMPYSTCDKKKMGGNADGDAVMTDKAAIMAGAYVDLYHITNSKKYLDAAITVANSLAKNQRPDGSWPFRVNPRTGEVKEPYTSSLIYAVNLFEALNIALGNDFYKKNRDMAFGWIMNNPVRTAEWRGFYEDVPAGNDNNRTNWDCIDVIHYLCKHKDEDPGYLQTAIRLRDYIQDSIISEGKTFIDREHDYQPAEGLREQKICFATMGVHSAHLAVMLTDLYRATGEETYLKRAIQTMNFVTYFMTPDGRIKTSLNDEQCWFSCHLGVDLFLLDFMSSFPETAGNEENHIVSCSSPVTQVKYDEKEVAYTTKLKSRDALKLNFKPKKIFVNGKVLSKGIDASGNGWKFDTSTMLLSIRHESGSVNIH